MCYTVTYHFYFIFAFITYIIENLSINQLFFKSCGGNKYFIMQYFKCAFEFIVLILCLPLVDISQGEKIDRCDFVRQLKSHRPQIGYEELNGWTCLAKYQSRFDTSLRNNDTSGAAYHGIFQISDEFWCSLNEREQNVCDVFCDQLHDTNLTDDFDCIQLIHDDHARKHGNGFGAWPIYQTRCNNGRDFVKDCMNDTENLVSLDKHQRNATKSSENKIYERCELARELRHVHRIPFEQIGTWVCIAKHESEFNTSAIGSKNVDGSLDHGLFQINDHFWCSPERKGCGLTCAELENGDISDDVVCMMKVYREHKRFVLL